MPYQAVKSWLEGELQEIRDSGLYKNEQVILAPQEPRVRTRDGGVVNFCANNDLGLAHHPEIVAAAREGLDSHGFGMASVRFICGTQDIHKELEAALSGFLGTEDTILYTSCFDANAGVRFDFGGFQVSAFSLGMNHDGSSGFRSRKFGLAASVAVCTGEFGLCRRRSDAPADTVTLPAPPPDTVIVERAIEAPPGPAGTPTTLCLSTGESVRVWVTVAGDTLVGRGRVSLDALGPAVVLAGTYAADRDWFEDGGAIGLAGRSYRRSGAPGPADCGGIERVGRHDGVPLFADRGAEVPFDSLYVPVRPGIWARYEN